MIVPRAVNIKHNSLGRDSKAFVNTQPNCYIFSFSILLYFMSPFVSFRPCNIQKKHPLSMSLFSLSLHSNSLKNSPKIFHICGAENALKYSEIAIKLKLIFPKDSKLSLFWRSFIFLDITQYSSRVATNENSISVYLP